MTETESPQILLCHWLNSGNDETLAKRRFDEYCRTVTPALLKSLNRFNYSDPKINRDMLQEATEKLLRLGRDRPKVALSVKALVFGLSLPERGEPFPKQLADWKTTVPAWIDRAMGFCQQPPAEICEQQANRINDELPPLLATSYTLLDWIGWQPEAANHEADKELSKLIQRRIKALRKLAKREGRAAVDAELKQPNGADFIFDTCEICKLAPKIKIPTTGLLYIIAANKIRDHVDKGSREISYNAGWDGEDPIGPDILTALPISESSYIGLQRQDCETLLCAPLRQAEAKLDEADTKLKYFRQKNCSPQQIKQAEEHWLAAKDSVTREEKRFNDNLRVFKLLTTPNSKETNIDPEREEDISKLLSSEINKDDDECDKPHLPISLPSLEPHRPNLQREDCLALLREPLRQAETRLAEANAKLERFRQENRQPRQIKQAEQACQEAKDAIAEETKRLHDNLQVFEWRQKINPEDKEPYSDTFIAEQIDFSDYERKYDGEEDPDGKKESERKRQRLRDCKADIVGLLLPLHPNPKQFLAKTHAQLGEFLLSVAESHGAAINSNISTADGEYDKTLSQSIDKLLKEAEKQIEAALNQAEDKRWRVEERLAALCLNKIADPADCKTQRQDLLNLLARAELGEREIAKRWKVGLEAVQLSARQWREAQTNIRQGMETLARQRERRKTLQTQAMAIVQLFIGPAKPKEIAKTLGLEVEQTYRVRQQIRDALNLPNT